ncbi:MAG: hypothetical protein GU359_01075 [Desulfurococcales archaeon]|nr:hypothetical protein [Desulfurococcales archaeon]
MSNTGDCLDHYIKAVDEGGSHVDSEPEKTLETLYKVFEEIIKILAYHHNVEDVMSRVEFFGEWSIEDLTNTINQLSEVYGEEIILLWDDILAFYTLNEKDPSKIKEMLDLFKIFLIKISSEICREK